MSVNKLFRLQIFEAPKSLNAGGNGSRQHWAAGHREKKHWQAVYGEHLLAAGVERDMAHCEVEVVIRWARNVRRDVDNYMGPISKPLADTLVQNGYLPDDSPEFFTFLSLRFPGGKPSRERVKAEMLINLYADYA